MKNMTNRLERLEERLPAIRPREPRDLSDLSDAQFDRLGNIAARLTSEALMDGMTSREQRGSLLSLATDEELEELEAIALALPESAPDQGF